MRFLARNCVAVFVIKENGRGVSTFIFTWIKCFDGLTDRVAFVVKYKKSKIKWIIMNAFQVSTMCTVIDAFPGIKKQSS